MIKRINLPAAAACTICVILLLTACDNRANRGGNDGADIGDTYLDDYKNSAASDAYSDTDDSARRRDRAVILGQEDSAAWVKSLFPGQEYDCHSPFTDTDNSEVCGGADDPLRRGLIRGVVYNTTINEDYVNIRSGPSYESDILFHVNKNTMVQIIGVSKESSLAGNAHWVQVRIKAGETDRYAPFQTGWLDGDNYWVFGWFVNYRNGQKIEPAEMRVEETEDGLLGFYEIDGIERTTKLRGHRHQMPDGSVSYSVFYSPHAEGSHYRLVPGSYEWRPNDGVFRHVSYQLQFCHVHGLPAPLMIK